jgi:hypothetical protein
MHARNRTWLLGSDPVERCRQRTLPVEGGDGSTLSLDFTTGVLDPRLTFTRSTNATFINSQGLVQYADSNIFYNSSWTDANNTPSAWSAGSGTASRSGETRTFTTSASQVTINQTRNTASGIRYTASVEVTAVTGSQRVDDVIVALGGSAYQYYFNGSAVAGTTTLTPGVISVAFTAGGATTTVRVGSGVQGTNTTGAVTLRYPQFEPGTVPLRTYRQNDSTTASYEAPRFDYDPTSIGTPRGLLIEGSASNLLKHSQGLFTSWIQFGTVGALTTGITSPSGDSSAVSLNLNTAGNNGYYTNNTQMGYTNTVGATYTFSIWVRATGSTTNLNIRFGDSAVGYSANIPITTSWQRLQYSYVAVAASGPTIASATGTATGVVELWGAQLEAGSGASSYIPTGASTGSRAADFCTMSSIGSWFNEPSGTFVSKVTYTALSGDNSGIEISVGTGASASNRIGIRKGYVDYYSGGSQSAEMYPTVTSGNVRIATAYSALDFAMCSNGGTMRTDSTGAVPVGLNTLKLYSDAGTSNTLCLFGWVSSIKYWPTRLPNAQLQALTT